MLGIIKPMRIPECLLVVVLGYLGFKHANVPPNLIVLASLFFVIVATMLQNDWRDRFHDVGKGKTFALEWPRLFLFSLVLSWVVCAILISTLLARGSMAAIMLLAMAVVGALYSETRQLPLLPVTLVTITVASVTLVPIGLGAPFADLAALFSTVFFIMFGRETLHDIADVKVDIGYKKTVPIVLGDRPARILASTSLLIGCVLAVYMLPLTLVGSICIVIGLIWVMKDVRVVWVRRWVDAGILLLALVFLVS